MRNQKRKEPLRSDRQRRQEHAEREYFHDGEFWFRMTVFAQIKLEPQHAWHEAGEN